MLPVCFIDTNNWVIDLATKRMTMNDLDDLIGVCEEFENEAIVVIVVLFFAVRGQTYMWIILNPPN
jgi:hypothetical protein